MSSNPSKNLLMTSSCLMTKPCPIVLFLLWAQVPLEWLHQDLRRVLEYTTPVVVFRVFKEYSFPGIYDKGLSTQ